MEDGSGVRGGFGHRPWQGVHAAAREVDAGDGVHVGDHGVRGEGAGGWDSGVQGLEGEDAAQPGVVEEAADLAVEGAEGAQRRESGEVGVEELEW